MRIPDSTPSTRFSIYLSELKTQATKIFFIAKKCWAILIKVAYSLETVNWV